MTNKSYATNNLDVLANDISYIRRDVSDIKDKLEGDYVTKESFEPIKRLVYGFVSLTLIAVIMGILALVLKR